MEKRYIILSDRPPKDQELAIFKEQLSSKVLCYNHNDFYNRTLVQVFDLRPKYSCLMFNMSSDEQLRYIGLNLEEVKHITRIALVKSSQQTFIEQCKVQIVIKTGQLRTVQLQWHGTEIISSQSIDKPVSKFKKFLFSLLGCIPVISRLFASTIEKKLGAIAEKK